MARSEDTGVITRFREMLLRFILPILRYGFWPCYHKRFFMSLGNLKCQSSAALSLIWWAEGGRRQTFQANSLMKTVCRPTCVDERANFNRILTWLLRQWGAFCYQAFDLFPLFLCLVKCTTICATKAVRTRRTKFTSRYQKSRQNSPSNV